MTVHYSGHIWENGKFILFIIFVLISGNFPTLEIRLKDLVNVVREKLEADTTSGGAGMKVKDIRLNGGAASHVLATETQPYNDLDLIFGVELSSLRNFDRVKSAVLSSLYEVRHTMII